MPSKMLESLRMRHSRNGRQTVAIYQRSRLYNFCQDKTRGSNCQRVGKVLFFWRERYYQICFVTNWASFMGLLSQILRI